MSMKFNLSPNTTEKRITVRVGPRAWWIVPTAEESPAGFRIAEGVYVNGDNLLVTEAAEMESVGDAIRVMIDIGSAGRAGC